MLRWFVALMLRCIVIFLGLLIVASVGGRFILPSGQIAAYAATPQGFRTDNGRFLYFFDVDRGLTHYRLSHLQANLPTLLSDWSSDGQELAILAEDDIYLLSMRDFRMYNATQSPSYAEYAATWSPDRKRIAFFATSVTDILPYSIGVLDVETGATTYRPLAIEAGTPHGRPTWSADSTRFTFVTGSDFPNARGRLEIVRFNRGQLVTQFTYDYDEILPENPRWLADEKTLAFDVPDFQMVNENGYTHTTVIIQIWLMDAQSNDSLMTGKFNSLDWAWSPDGKQIVYAVEQNGYKVLTISDVEFHETRQLTSIPESSYCPVWSPDGHWIAMISTQQGEESIDLFDAISGERQHLAVLYGSPNVCGGGSMPLQWSDDGRWLTVLTNHRLINGTIIDRTYLVNIERREVLPHIEYLFDFLWQPG